MGHKNDVLKIRCSKETKRKFKVYVVGNGFSNYEECLRFLLEKAEELKWQPPFKHAKAF